MLRLTACRKSLPLSLSGPGGAALALDRDAFPARAWEWAPILHDGRAIGRIMVRNHPLSPYAKVFLDLPPEWRVERADLEPSKMTTQAAGRAGTGRR